LRKDISYGIIPCKKVEESWHVLLAQHVSGNWWGFPKGHAENCELPKMAAERELFEETSLVVENYLTEEIFEEVYFFTRDGKTIEKTVIYYLAEVSGTEKPQIQEVCALKWVPLDFAEPELSYEESRSLLRKAQKILNNQQFA